MTARAVLHAWARQGLAALGRRCLPPAVRLALGVSMAGVLLVPPGQARPNATVRDLSQTLVTFCSYNGLVTDPGCPPLSHAIGTHLYPDWGAFSPLKIASFGYTFTYDPKVLRFNSSRTSLLCSLRAPGVAPYCPNFAAGVGTMPLTSSADTFAVDQTYLTLTEDAATSSVSVEYNSPVDITTLGERHFLALAFDLVAPLGSGATVTYSTGLLDGASLTTTDAYCIDAAGGDVDCSSSQPSASLRINRGVIPAPGPLAIAGLPAMVHASRRLRRRVGRFSTPRH